LTHKLLLRSDAELLVFDTTELSNITLMETIPVPPVTGSPEKLWGIAALANNAGGRAALLIKACTTSPQVACPIELTLISITQDAVQVAPPQEIVADYPSGQAASARGNIQYDKASEQVVVTIPNTDTTGDAFGVGELGSTMFFTISNDFTPGRSTLPIQQPGNQHGTVAIDPCFSVLYVMSAQSTTLSGVPYATDTGVPIFDSIGIKGQRIAYEPHTRSIIMVQDEEADFGLDAYSLTGTEETPDTRKRVTDWVPPTFRPKFVAVAGTPNVICD
jgi:hypothetical protein